MTPQTTTFASPANLEFLQIGLPAGAQCLWKKLSGWKRHSST